MKTFQESIFSRIKNRMRGGEPCKYLDCYPQRLRPIFYSDLKCLINPKYEDYCMATNAKRTVVLIDVFGEDVNWVNTSKYVIVKSREDIEASLGEFINSMLTPLGKKVVNEFGIEYYIKAFQYNDKLPNIEKRLPQGYDAIYALVNGELLFMMTPGADSMKKPRNI